MPADDLTSRILRIIAETQRKEPAQVTIDSTFEELGIDSKHARRYLEPLSEAGIIIETSSGPRSRVWRSPEVIAALDAFAERARRGGLGR